MFQCMGSPSPPSIHLFVCFFFFLWHLGSTQGHTHTKHALYQSVIPQTPSTYSLMETLGMCPVEFPNILDFPDWISIVSLKSSHISHEFYKQIVRTGGGIQLIYFVMQLSSFYITTISMFTTKTSVLLIHAKKRLNFKRRHFLLKKSNV